MKKTLIALAGALVLLAVLLLKNRGETRSARADAFAFDTARKGEVTRLKSWQGVDTSVLTKMDGRWVTVADTFPVDTAKINKVLSTLLGLQNKVVVSRNPERLSEFGLDSAQVKHLEWQGKGGEVKVQVGKTSGTDYSSTYWKLADQPDVYQTPGNFTWELAVRDGDWKDRSLFKVEAKDLRSIEVDWRDSLGKPTRYKVNAVDDTTLRLVEPDSVAVKRDKARDILARAEFTIDDFVAKADTNAPRAAVDSPEISLRFLLKDGKAHELKVGKTFDGYAYARHPKRPELVKLGTWRFDAFKQKPFELADPEADAAAAKADSSAPAQDGAAGAAKAAKPKK